ncbi:MAG: NAD(P)-dependent oxidoreductase, partial [Gammaproteobacteria bacterium]
VHGGSQWRPNVHVKDVCSVIIKTLNAPIESVSRQVFNVGGNANNHTIMELAESAVGVFRGCRLKINNHVADKRNYRVDFSKIENELGFRPEYSVEAGLLELKEYFSQNLDIDVNSHLFSNIEFLKRLQV